MKLPFWLALSVSSSLFALPAQVIIIRHGEKPATGNDLAPQGFERADALATFFQTAPFVLNFGLPKAIFASKPAPVDPSMREIETITPTAAALGLPVHSPFPTPEVTDLAQLILNESKYDGKMVLICWEHKVMDQLAFAFGVNPMPPPYPGSRFDLVYVITYQNQATPQFCVFPQELMFGDQSTVPFDACP